MNDDDVERTVSRGRVSIDDSHLRERSRRVDGATDTHRRIVVEEDDNRSPGETRPRGDDSHHLPIALADLKRFFTESNAAHRHRERVSFDAAFAQKHAHFVRIRSKPLA